MLDEGSADPGVAVLRCILQRRPIGEPFRRRVRVQAEREQPRDVPQLAVDRRLPQLALDVPGRAQLGGLRLGQRRRGAARWCSWAS